MAYLNISVPGETVGSEAAQFPDLLASILNEVCCIHDDDATQIFSSYLDDLAEETSETVPNFLRQLADEIERRHLEP
ncbi:hypothetical protein [Roseibium aggregatum]|uniref:hypothetical protein n=1 Tax=Roseibium aggregatum TaxID=187304 RepID=UPI0025ABA32B|nr:hypothetical protein [Roseibium aggregatum]WJS05182.1 hypothetical protein QUB73_13125 [Roseibium aggregatum]